MKKVKMLAIDLGASSGRGIVGTFDGKRFTLEENHRFPNEPVMVAGQFTWDILRILHEIKTSIRNCANSDDRDIASIGIDTWGVDFGFLDKKGHLIGNPVHYRDVLSLYFFYHHSIPEIAKLLHIKPATANSRFTRGRKKLIDMLERKGFYG